MKKYRMLACASALFVCTAPGCAGAPETTEEAAPAAVREEPAAPAPDAVAEATSDAPEESGEPAARPRLATPVRGIAQLGYTAPVVKNGTIDGREFVITTIQVKNMAAGSIAGLRVDEFWYDREGNAITGANFRHPTPLQPGEEITVTLETPRNPQMDRNQYSFTHANGDILASLQTGF